MFPSLHSTVWAQCPCITSQTPLLPSGTYSGSQGEWLELGSTSLKLSMTLTSQTTQSAISMETKGGGSELCMTLSQMTVLIDLSFVYLCLSFLF